MILKLFSFSSKKSGKSSSKDSNAAKRVKFSRVASLKRKFCRSSKKVVEQHEGDNDSIYTLAPSQFYKPSSSSSSTNGFYASGHNNENDRVAGATKTNGGESSEAAPSNQAQAAYSAKGDNPLLPEELSDIPTFVGTPCCDAKLIDETRRLLKEGYLANPQDYSREDYERVMSDDWTVSRFLLRCRLCPIRSAKLIEEFSFFRRHFKMGETKPCDFPIEFHRSGGLFRYAPDRVGNQTLYMRAKLHCPMPEVREYFKAFILCLLEECDRANNGRGTAVILDLTGAGYYNADSSFLIWLVYSFRDFCPKGLSYIVIYNLPWFLNATAKIATSWLSQSNKRRLRFVSGDGIRYFIAPENLPDFMGGTCKIDYRQVPEGAINAEEKALEQGITREQSRKNRENYLKFLRDTGQGDVQLDYETPENSSEDSESKRSIEEQH